ncbi:MAG TPA: 30S ribosomal protein S2 [archaeon]|nr:30S ribosomal protein S2 [archaeon]
MLTDKAEYLSVGIHIGMKSCSKYLKQFVYKTREDGLSVFNLEEVDSRIVIAAKFLSKFKKIMVISHKSLGDQAARKLADVIGGKPAIGRFSPGTLTNPSYRDFYEPDVVFVTDPLVDSQAIVEAKKRRVPIVALCDTSHEGNDIDLIIPINNNGKKSLCLAFWLLSREILKNRGEIKKDSEFKFTLKDFGDDGVKKASKPTEDFEGDISVEIENVESAKEPKKAKKPAAAAKKKAKPVVDNAEKVEDKTEDEKKVKEKPTEQKELEVVEKKTEEVAAS